MIGLLELSEITGPDQYRPLVVQLHRLSCYYPGDDGFVLVEIEGQAREVRETMAGVGEAIARAALQAFGMVLVQGVSGRQRLISLGEVGQVQEGTGGTRIHFKDGSKMDTCTPMGALLSQVGRVGGGVGAGGDGG